MEGSSAHLIDELWIVTAPHNKQLDRLVHQRGYDRATAEQRLDAQTNPIDKEREFRALRPNIPVHYLENAETVEELRATGDYPIYTPEEMVDRARQLGPGGTVMLHPLVGGIDPEVSWEMLEVFEKRVIPALSEA